MSFWDTQEADEEVTTQSLIEKGNPDIKELLQCEDLFTSFRSKEDYLIEYLTKQDVMKKLLQLILTSNEKKLVKTSVQLFVAAESPLLLEFFKDKNFVISVLMGIKSYGFVPIGYLTQFIEKGLKNDNSKDVVKDLLKTPEMFALFISNIGKKAIADTFCAFLATFKPEEQWQQWLFLCISCMKRFPTPAYLANFNNEINEAFKKIPVKYYQHEILQILNIMKQFIIDSAANESIVNAFQPYISFLPKLPIIYQIGSLMKKNDQLYERALVDAQVVPSIPLSVNALDYISLFPSEKSLTLFPKLFEQFKNYQNNTFFLEAFVKFVKSISIFADFDKLYLNSLKQLVLERSKRNLWRKFASSVGFLLEIGTIIDEKCTGDDWEQFRNSELATWRARDEEEENTEIDAISFSVDSQSVETPQITGVGSNSDDFTKAMRPDQFKDIFADFKKNNEKNPQNSFENSSSETFDDEIKKIDDFPEFDPIPKVKDNSFNSDKHDDLFFSAEENSQKSSQDFGTKTPEIKATGVEEKKGDDFAFPASFAAQEKKEDSGFGGFFDEVDNKKQAAATNNSNDFSGFFDSADVKKGDIFSFPAEKKQEESFGGFFDDADDKKQHEKKADDFVFPTSFPAEEKKADESFGGFFDDVKTDEKKEDDFSFPASFPEEKKDEKKNETFGGFFDDVSFDEKKPEEKKADDFVFPTSFPEEKKENNVEFGGFFDDVKVDEKKEEKPKTEEKKADDFEFPASFPEEKKEEKKEETFGGFFDDVKVEDKKPEEEKKQDDFEFPTSFPEEKKEETAEFGGFFDEVSSTEKKEEKPKDDENKKADDFIFPASFPEEKKENNVEFGGFFDDVKVDEKKEEEKKADDFSFPASFPEEKKEEKKEEAFGGFFDDVKADEKKPEEEKKQDDFSFPTSFPEEKKEETAEFGGFFDEVSSTEKKEEKPKDDEKKKEDDFSFPASFPEEKKENNVEFGGFFDDVKVDENKPEEKKADDFEFPASFPEEKKEEGKADELGGFFDDVNSNEKKEETQKKDDSSSPVSQPEEKKDAKPEEPKKIVIQDQPKKEDESKATKQKAKQSEKESNDKKKPKPATQRKVSIPKPGEKIKRVEEDVSLGVEDDGKLKNEPIIDDFEEDSDDEYAPADMFKETAPKPQEAQNDNFTPFGEITFPDDFPADFTGVAVEGKEADPEKIIELLHDSIWEAPANSATEFFASSNKFDSEEKAFLFLTEEK